jgi:bis(5'-nucleosidyl)-tetraphosphatase
MRYRRDRSAGVIVFHRDEGGCHFLLLLSRLTKRPLWEFPKGGIDDGESAAEAALRELQEETGLGTDDIRLIPEFQHREEYRFTSGKGEGRTLVRKEVVYFLAEALTREVRLSAHEASQYAWLPLEEAARKLKYKARRDMLSKAASTAGCIPDDETGYGAGDLAGAEPATRGGSASGRNAGSRAPRAGAAGPDGDPQGGASPTGDTPAKPARRRRSGRGRRSRRSP